MYLGNPMFSAWIPECNRRISIVQVPPEEAAELYVSGFLKTFELEENQPPLDLLGIDLVLSEEALSIAKGWIQAWLIKNTSKEQLEALLNAQTVVVE